MDGMRRDDGRPVSGPGMPAMRPAVGPGRSETRTTRVLYAEDDEANFQLVRRVLALDGHDVTRARNGEDALRLARTRVPDLLLVDLVLPGMDGYELVRRMRKEASLAVVPVVALTGMVGREDRERAMREGFAGYVEKPFRVETLRTEVRRALGGRGATDEGVAGRRRGSTRKDGCSR